MDTTGIQLKHCWSCKGHFPATVQYFHRDSTKSDGLHGCCKACKCGNKSNWQKKNWADVYTPHPREPLINRQAENTKYIWQSKESGVCCMCGEQRTEVLQYHHRDPSDKYFLLSRPRSRPLETIKEEIAKCDLMCANCHISLHYWERHK